MTVELALDQFAGLSMANNFEIIDPPGCAVVSLSGRFGVEELVTLAEEP